MRKLFWVLVFVLLVPVAAAQPTAPDNITVITRASAPDPASVRLVEVSSGYRNPLYVTHAGDGSDRLFVMEQAGRIWVYQNGARLNAPFADFADIVSQDILYGYSERGLLGLAFHPNFAENGVLFINYTDAGGTTRLARYRVQADNPNAVDRQSAEILLSIEQPFRNHNGGHIAFGPDGYLYMSVGDGGAANDPLRAGQDLTTILGTLIRIDVDNTSDDKPYAIPDDNPFLNTPGAVPEIWAYGLRNVWRFSFDRATGDAYIADVGQNAWEEVNFQPAGQGGANYGWNIFEGNNPFAGSAVTEDMVFPIAEYRHRDGDCSVTGGYVYRGQAVPELVGVYLFGDYCTGRIWATYRDEGENWQTNVFMNARMSISSFGEDEAGELYVVDYSGGRVLRFEAAQ